MNYIYNFSLNQINGIRYYENGIPVLNNRKSDLFPISKSNMEKFRKLYSPFPQTNNEILTEDEIINYSNIVNNTLQKCPHCEVICCEYCIKNNAIHNNNQCKRRIWDICKNKYYTWRYYTMNKTLLQHEDAIIKSYYNPLIRELWGDACPCQIVGKITYNELLKVNLIKNIPKKAIIYHIENLSSP